jgi:hypothetical protein
MLAGGISENVGRAQPPNVLLGSFRRVPFRELVGLELPDCAESPAKELVTNSEQKLQRAEVIPDYVLDFAAFPDSRPKRIPL